MFKKNNVSKINWNKFTVITSCHVSHISTASKTSHLIVVLCLVVILSFLLQSLSHFLNKKQAYIIKKPHLQPRTQTEPWFEFRFPTWRTHTNTKISIEGVGGSHFKTGKSCFLGSFMLLLRQVSVGKWNSLIPNLQVLHLVGWNRTEKSPKEHEADRNSDKWLPPCASALLWTDLFLSWRKVGKSHTLNIWPVWSHLTDNLHQIVLSCTYS